MDADSKLERFAFSAAMRAAGIVYDREVKRSMLEVYWTALESFAVDDVVAAINEHLTESVYFPKPADIIRRIGGDKHVRAVLAWGVVLEAHALGSWVHVDFEDKTVNATIRSLGGWPAMFERCKNTEGESIYRAQFLKTYVSMAGRLNAENSRPLPGLSEANRVQRDQCGHITRMTYEPTRIGCDYDKTTPTIERQPVANIETTQTPPRDL